MLVNYSEAEPEFPEFLSLDELILLVAKSKKATSESVKKLKDIFGVHSYAKNPISSYSSGMLKKAALLLAFLGNPQLIILDEPFTTIDVKAQEKLFKLINDYLSLGVNFLVSSHHFPNVDNFTFKSIIDIKNGKLESPL
jgi:ABC-2 type transport system ATP-binding protein